MNTKIAVLGGGSFGTAWASLVASLSYNVTLWCFEEDVVDDIISTRMNNRYLPAIPLSNSIYPTTSLQETLENNNLIFIAIPVRHIRTTIEPLQATISSNHHLVLLSKGIEQNSCLVPSDIINTIVESKPRLSIITGPTFAQELAHKEPSAALVASNQPEDQKELMSLLHTSFFNVFPSSDIQGAQLCGALKNVVALLMGIARGEECTHNTLAFLFTQGMQEIALIVKALGGKEETVYHLAGIGDAVLTIFGNMGRNHRAGVMIGQGASVREVIETLGHEPEGINTVKAVYEIINHHHLECPLLKATHSIIFEGSSLKALVLHLLDR